MSKRGVDPGAEMLFAHLQLRSPGWKSVLLASATPREDVRRVADGLRGILVKLGRSADVIDVHPIGAGGEGDQLPYSVSSIRQLLESREGATIVIGAGILSSAGTLLACVAVDAVVLVAIQGTTARSDLVAAQTEIQRAGGNFIGAVLVV